MGKLMDKKEFRKEAILRGYATKDQINTFLKEHKSQEIFVENDLIDLYRYAEFLQAAEAHHIQQLFQPVNDESYD